MESVAIVYIRLVVRALIPGSSNSQRFQYDAANRLANVKSDNNQTIIASYTYGDTLTAIRMND